MVHHATESKEYWQWFNDLKDLSAEQIQLGIDKSKEFTDFLTPARFRALCKPQPEDYGLPDKEAAYVEACNAPNEVWKNFGHFTHRAVYWSGVKVGFYELRRGQGKQEFMQEYFRRCQQAMNGVLPDYPQHEMIPARVEVKPSNEAVRAHMDGLKNLFGD